MCGIDSDPDHAGATWHPRIMVAGAGAVGSFYGAKLAQGGARVSLLCQSDYDVVLRDGVRIESVWGDFHFTPESVVNSASGFRARFGPADIVMVALKALPCIDAPGMIRDAVGPGTVIFPLQNGLDAETSFVKAFPGNAIISGLAFVCLNRIRPGLVRHLDFGRVVIGRYPSGVDGTARSVCAMLERAGVPVRATPDIVMERWLKLVWNAPFNPLSVLSGGFTTREMVESAECANTARKVMEEVVSVAAATGVRLPDDAVSKNMADTAVMKPYKTSMCLDYEAGRPLEVEAILGQVVAVARRLAVPVPRMETLYALLQAVDRGRKAKRAVVVK